MIAHVCIRVMIFCILIKFFTNTNNIIPSSSGGNFFNKSIFFFRKFNPITGTSFKIKIDTINKIQFIQIYSFSTKEVFTNQLKITISKRLTSTRILVFDLTFNSCIFNYIQKRFEARPLLRGRLMPSCFWSPKSMSNFVKNHKIIQRTAHLLPNWKTEDTILYIK